MNTTPSTPNGSSESQTSSHRRSREEVEALAKNFVATPVVETPVAKPKMTMAMMGGGAAVVAIVLAVVLWPKGRSDAERAQAEANRAAAAAEAEQYRQRFEAERERKRAEVAAGKEYLERMAAADAAALKDLSETAGALADRAARAPAATTSDQPPTPRDAKAAAAKPAPAPAASQPAPTTTTASTAPAKTAPAPAAAAPQPSAQDTAKAPPAQAAPAPAATQEVAQADKAECSIHVSELSKSGKLTYADVKRMKGARVDDATGNVFTPPVQAGGRTVVFEVFPNGCVQLVRSSLGGR